MIDREEVERERLAQEIPALMEYLRNPSTERGLRDMDASQALDEVISELADELRELLLAVRELRRTWAIHDAAVNADRVGDGRTRAIAGGLIAETGAESGPGSIRDARKELKRLLEAKEEKVSRLQTLMELRSGLPEA